MKTFRILAVGTFLLLVTSGAKADNILYFIDGANGTDQMAAALATLSGDTVTVASSAADFATKIATDTYQLGIFSAQESYSPDYSSALAALGTFVTSDGGKAIVDSWFTPLYSDLAPFDATTSSTADLNLTSMNLTSFNSGVTNPVAVANTVPTYGTFSVGLSALAGGTVAGTFTANSLDASVIVGNSGASIVNGFLNDTAGAPGEQIYINEIDSLLSPNTSTVPEPSSIPVLGAGMALLLFVLIRRRKQAVASL